MALRDEFLGASFASEIVDGPAGRVLVRSLSIGGKDRLQAAGMLGGNFRAIVMLECLFDPDTGKPLFTKDDEPDKVPAHIAEVYIDAAFRLSALKSDEVKELEGNSERTLSVSTGSA